MDRQRKALKVLKDNRLLLGILVGVLIGLIVGILSHDAVRDSADSSPKRLAMYVKFPGELFIRMLKMIVIPLITSSIIVALTDIDISSAGRLGKRTLAFYLTTSVLSSMLGLIVASILKPGSGVNEKTDASKDFDRNSVDSLLDLLRNCFPDNIVEAFFSTALTIYQKKEVNFRYETRNFTLSNLSAEAMAQFLRDNQMALTDHSNNGILTVIKHDVSRDFDGVGKSRGTNMIGLIVISIAFGIVFNIIKEEGKSLVSIFKSLWSATMKLVEIVMWLAPIGICSVVAGNIVETKDIGLLFRAMGLFVLANAVGNLIQAVVFYPGLYLIFVRRNPLKHVRHILPALLTAFGTSSSAATLPTTIECCESRAQIDKRVTRFVLPIGATCNMDGTANYMAVTVLFIEQMEPNVHLGVGDKIFTIIICTLMSVGIAGVPNSSLAGLVIILEAVGLPADKLGPIFAVHWLLGGLQTIINVMGDSYAAAIVAKFSQNDFEEDQEHEEDESRDLVQNHALKSIDCGSEET